MLNNLCCKCGTYECYVLMITFGPVSNRVISVDGCLAAELCSLWRRGIVTLGCCCGHERDGGYIQVSPSHVRGMLDLGYEQIPEVTNDDGSVMGSWCFRPRTEFPDHEYIDEVVARELPVKGGEASC